MRMSNEKTQFRCLTSIQFLIEEVYYQKGVGGEIILDQVKYVTSQPGCSSILEPNKKILKFYNRQEWYEIDNVYEIQTSSLESIKNELKLESPYPFLKNNIL